MSLRGNVRLLGEILGRVLQEQAGHDLFALVEGIRQTCKELRAQYDEERALALQRQIAAMPLARAVEVVRAFAIYFQLVNIAEQHHRARRRREYEWEPVGQRASDTLQGAAARLWERLGSDEAISRLLNRLEVILVATAHPTEPARRTVLDKHATIFSLLERLEQGNLTPRETEQVHRALHAEITALWQTDELREQPPTPIDEVQQGLYYFDQFLFDLLPAIHAELQHHLGVPVPPFLRFGSWIGGDRDGNPNVTAAVTRMTLWEHKRFVLRKYMQGVAAAAKRLSSSLRLAGVSEELLASLRADEAALPSFARYLGGRYASEPYRRKLAFMHRKLEIALEGGSAGDRGYRSPQELAADLAVIRRSLEAHRGGALVDAYLDRLERQVALFGFHLAALDVREHAPRLARAMAQALAAAGEAADYLALDSQRRLDLLGRYLGRLRVDAQALDEDARDVWEAFRAIRWAQQEIDRDAVGAVVISMAKGPDDALAALCFLQAAGAEPVDIVPLFEQLHDLRRSGRTLAEMLSHPGYAAHVRARGNRQEVMLGYSDSGKEAGYVAATWAIYRAQETLAAVGRRFGVDVGFFYGRGGALGRGGGHLGRAILAQPPGLLPGRIRITQQGEVLSHRFSPAPIAARTLEQVIAAVCDASTLPAAELPRAWTEAMDAMAEAALQAWRSLVEDPDFYAYFRSATPIDAIERLQLGSRPARRRPSHSLEDLRAIPWVFSWTQSRHLLPAWFGYGTGALSVGEEGLLREMYQGWPFFRTLTENAALALAKADMAIAAQYASLAADTVPGARVLFERIREEYERTRAAVLAASGESELLDSQPALQASVRLRNPYVDPLSYVQVELLRRLRRQPPPEEGDALLEALLRTVNGIAHALRNTG